MTLSLIYASSCEGVTHRKHADLQAHNGLMRDVPVSLYVSYSHHAIPLRNEMYFSLERTSSKRTEVEWTETSAPQNNRFGDL